MEARAGVLASGRDSGCKFCELVAGAHAHHPRDAVIAESEFFVAFPSIGALVPGWVLVAPRNHTLSLATLDEDQISELENFSRAVGQRIEAEFGAPVSAFEHGATAAMQSVGCGVDHAHLHLVPLAFDLVAAARDQLAHLRPTGHTTGFSGLRAACADTSYVFLRNHLGEELVIREAASHSQLIRRVIAREVGAPDEWNWREHPALPTADRTGSRLLDRAR